MNSRRRILTAARTMGSSSTGNHALVFGASGISGWAVVNQILSDYPAKGGFSAVTALTNRPLPVEYALWPKDSRLDIVSGLDLMKGSQQELEASIKEKIKGIENVTQVYFFCKSAYITWLPGASAITEKECSQLERLSLMRPSKHTSSRPTQTKNVVATELCWRDPSERSRSCLLNCHTWSYPAEQRYPPNCKAPTARLQQQGSVPCSALTSCHASTTAYTSLQMASHSKISCL